MKTLTLIRTLYTDEATFGTLIDDNQNFICHMLELPWRDNKHDISCIPVGTYHCTYMPHDGGFRYAVHDVPNRTLIRIHVANEPEELLGCLAPGRGFLERKEPYIYDSRIAINQIAEIAPKEFTLRIRELWIK